MLLSLDALFWLLLGGESAHARKENIITPVFCNAVSGYRFYDPNLQRWLNRNLLEEQGGINLYEFVGNRPISNIDPEVLFDHYYSNGTILQTFGPVPFFNSDNMFHNIRAAVYNTNPLYYKHIYGGMANIGTEAGESSGSGITFSMAVTIAGDVWQRFLDEGTLSRLGTSRESLSRLARKAAEAEEKIGIHRVTANSGKPCGPASQAARKAVEETIPVHNTPAKNDPLHCTIELPKLVTLCKANEFNKVFGRDSYELL